MLTIDWGYVLIWVSIGVAVLGFVLICCCCFSGRTRLYSTRHPNCMGLGRRDVFYHTCGHDHHLKPVALPRDSSIPIDTPASGDFHLLAVYQNAPPSCPLCGKTAHTGGGATCRDCAHPAVAASEQSPLL